MEKIWYLKNINLLSGINERDMQQINSRSMEKIFLKDKLIYAQDDVSRYIYFLKYGKIKLYQTDRTGKELTFTILTAGESFGGILNTGKITYNEYARAIEESLICLIDKDLFFEIIKKDQTITLKLNRLLGLRVFELEILLRDLVFKSVYERIASLLIRLYDKNSRKLSHKNKITFSHYDIATMVGATREAATLALNKLKNDGLIDLQRKNIFIVDYDKLKEVE